MNDSKKSCSLSAIAIILTIVGFHGSAPAAPVRSCENLFKISTRTSKRETLLKTADVKQFVSPELLQSISAIEAQGAEGGWYKSVSPFSQDGKPEFFFVLQKIPAKADENSPIRLLRLEHSRKFLSDLISLGHTVVYGEIPMAAGVEAAALGPGVQLADDGIKTLGIASHKSIMLLQTTADKYTLAHENQHWMDYEDPTFLSKFDVDMKPITDLQILTPEENQWMLRIAWEIRGHSAQQIKIKTDEAAGLPILNRIGEIIHAPAADLKNLYQFEDGQATSSFLGAYPEILYSIHAKIQNHGIADANLFRELISKYDMSANPLATLSFKKILTLAPEEKH